MNPNWTSVTDFIMLSLFLGIATYIKRNFKFFQKYLIPTSIIAGFVGLILGPEVLNILSLNSSRLTELIYHLMAIGFIALSLKDRSRYKNKDIQNTGITIVSTYLVQGILGFVLTFVFIYTTFPDLFPTFGLLLPLGFGQGPGQAASIGKQWQDLGFAHGENIGLSIATLGFLWACLGGIPLINYLVKKKNYIIPQQNNTSVSSSKIQETEEAGEAPLSDSMDRISIQLYLIGIVYLATYLSLQGLSMLLTPLGTFGQTLSQLLWGFHFIIGTVYAILLRLIFDYFKKKKIMIHNYPNNYLLQRISGGCFDFMIAASIAAISISTLKAYIVPILVISTLGGVLTAVYIYFISKTIYKQHQLEYIVSLYGMLTGTISTGLALLKEVDPNFETPVAENLVFGSAVGLVAGFPLMIILNIPIFGYIEGKPIMYAYTLLALVAYLIVLKIILFRSSKTDKSKKQKIAA